MSKRVAVIIPFYQEEKGILSQAIKSAMCQKLPDDTRIWIIVVDDISPVSAKEELATIPIPDHVEVTVYQAEQNGGPGAARNIGLDLALNAGATFVAFLDSDDRWLGDHLANAISMLEQDCDAYFSDHRRVDDYAGAFAEGSPIFWTSPEVRAACAAAGTADDARFVLEGDFVRLSLVREYIFQTSTVVYRIDRLGKIRFDERLRSAGEDHLFWFDLALGARRFGVCRGVEVECGQGVNVYFGSFSWKNPRAVDRYGYRYLMFREMRARGVSVAADRRWLTAEAGRMRNLYCYLLLRHLLRGNLPNWKLLKLVASNAIGRRS